MDEKWETKVKKLALAYHTGWEYRPGSKEAGSVLTDIFLDMERENRKRYGKIWKKHKQRFLSAVPEAGREERVIRTALAVRASGKSDGAWLMANTGFYTVPEEGSLLHFRTISPIRLTAARLCHAVYRDGFCAWLTYAGEEGGPLALFVPRGEEIARPEFRWSFAGLCDGREDFSFSVQFREAEEALPELRGEWHIRCGEITVPAKWQQGKTGISLCGECAGFGAKFDSSVYELCFMAGEEPGQEWLKALYGGFTLEEGGGSFEPKRCLTDEGDSSAKRVLPFGRMLPEAACCYFACDRAAAGGGGQVTMRFAERYEKEEKLPPPVSAEYKKMYRKYPWLRQTEEVLDWQPEECAWEYFDGNFWRALPGSGEWQTGCHPERDGEQECRFSLPSDMKSCLVEGEEHYFIRLRLVRVRNAYAAYHRKYIPVLEDIRFFTQGRRIGVETCSLPEREWAGKRMMYLGFDREITPDQRWYTGGRELMFGQGQIIGWGSNFGREAFWVQLEEGEPEVFPEFCPNYVSVRQVFSEEDAGERGEIPQKVAAGSLFFSETGEFGTLTAVSLPDAECGARVKAPFAECGSPDGREGMHGENGGLPGVGEKTPDTGSVEGNYFSHCGRLVTQMDLKLYMREKYPQLCLVSCGFSEEDREFFVVVRDREGAGELPPEFEEWLADILSGSGGLWFGGVRVTCRLAEI